MRIGWLSVLFCLILLSEGGLNSRAETPDSGKTFDLTPIILQDKFWTLDKTALVSYGHEIKRMSLEDAYTITSGLYLIEAK